MSLSIHRIEYKELSQDVQLIEDIYLEGLLEKCFYKPEMGSLFYVSEDKIDEAFAEGGLSLKERKILENLRKEVKEKGEFDLIIQG